MFSANCYLALGRYLNIPVVGMVTSLPLDWQYDAVGTKFNTAVIPGLWSGYVYPMNFWERLGNTLDHYLVMAQFYFYGNKQNELVEKYFGPGYPSTSELLKDLDILLVNSHYSSDGVKAITPSIIPVGGLHIFDDGTKLPNVSNFKLCIIFLF